MKQIYRQTLVDMLKESIGIEAAEKVVLEAARDAGLPSKQSYSSDEYAEICNELKNRGGLIKTIATIASDSAYSTLNYQKELARERDEKESLARMSHILEQKVGERTRQLRESEEKYRVIFENTGTATIIMEEDMTISLANSEFERLSGYSRGDLEGKKKWAEFFPEEAHVLPGDTRPHGGENHTPEMQKYEFRFHDREGGIKQVFVTVGTIPMTTKRVASLLDVSSHKKLEAQLMQAHKMQAIGLLAGGIAHDFNNVLTAILGYGTLMRLKIEENHPLLSYIDQIISAAERAAALTNGLLAFSRKQAIEPMPIDITEIINRMEKLLRRLIGEDIELKTDLSRNKLIVMADTSQIEQVIMNLATNARHAMPNGGSLTIHTTSVILDDTFVREHSMTTPGKYLLVMVSDTGVGMDETTRERIFEPFFTTKESSQGTGLGLSIVYGIVKQHDGHIDCYSEPDVGTVFKIYLPLTETAAEDEEAVSLPLIGGSETVLIAEDDPYIRIVVREMLSEFGYKVLEASDGEEAVKVFREHDDEIQLLLLDVIMPKLNGKEVFDTVSKIRPDVKAIFMSGYTADILHKKGIIEGGGFAFLLKPLSPQPLLVKVREVLDGIGDTP